MRIWLALFFTVLLCFAAEGPEADRVAVILGESISRGSLPADGDEQARARRLLELIWVRLAPHYVAQHGLGATPQEIEELAAHNREFERRDREQRARKLEELEERLASDRLSEKERAWLEEFRAILRRMARREAQAQPEPADPLLQAKQYTPWIELWKMNQALYREYGGTVAVTRLGHDPHGARAALFEDYERQGLLRFSDPRLRDALYRILKAPPAAVVPPAEVDFTPYWKRPIPPSYFPD